MIWIFGDSFSVSFDQPQNEPPLKWKEYVEFLGFVPKMYFDYLSEDYQTTIQNFSRGGMDNVFIFQKFMENCEQIKPEDIVIFGWTEITRFKFVGDGNTWISSSTGNKKYLSESTLNQIKVNRSHELYRNELMTQINFINKILPNNKVIHWTWSEVLNGRFDLNIVTETGGKVNDNHFSQIGQKYLYELITKGLTSGDKIKIGYYPPKIKLI